MKYIYLVFWFFISTWRSGNFLHLLTTRKKDPEGIEEEAATAGMVTEGKQLERIDRIRKNVSDEKLQAYNTFPCLMAPKKMAGTSWDLRSLEK